MPIMLPNRPRAKAVEKRRLEKFASTDWLVVWSLSIALSALLLAAIVYFGCGDQFGASYVMLGAAALIAVVLRVGAEEHTPD